MKGITDFNHQYKDAATSTQNIHNDFKLHIDDLLTATFNECGITEEVFYAACNKSRYRRDINALVFERLMAVDDFVTFKQIMVSRNNYLEMETLLVIEKQANTMPDYKFITMLTPQKLRTATSEK